MDTEIMHRKIKCGYINIPSVGNITLEINELIIDRKFDILALAETWLSEYDKARICEMTPNTQTIMSVPKTGRREGV